jgi:uncharacterized protein (DUF934 family)
MRLVKRGQIIEDRFVRLADEAPAPGRGAVLVSADRLIADAAELARRAGPTGVIWPNNRKITELRPHLDWLAAVALCFPKFRDGRAYSQARQLRETFRFRGELRATGQVLRDQFVFLLRAGFDAFEVAKDSDAAVFADVLQRYSVFYQPTGDGHITAMRARLAATRAVFRPAIGMQEAT